MNRSYVAIAERPSKPGQAWWISFPNFPGVTSAADTADAIESQARDALATAIEALRAQGQALPAAVEETGLPAYDLADYDHPLVLLIPSPALAEAA